MKNVLLLCITLLFPVIHSFPMQSTITPQHLYPTYLGFSLPLKVKDVFEFWKKYPSKVDDSILKLYTTPKQQEILDFITIINSNIVSYSKTYKNEPIDKLIERIQESIDTGKYYSSLYGMLFYLPNEPSLEYLWLDLPPFSNKFLIEKGDSFIPLNNRIMEIYNLNQTFRRSFGMDSINLHFIERDRINGGENNEMAIKTMIRVSEYFDYCNLKSHLKKSMNNGMESIINEMGDHDINENEMKECESIQLLNDLMIENDKLNETVSSHTIETIQTSVETTLVNKNIKAIEPLIETTLIPENKETPLKDQVKYPEHLPLFTNGNIVHDVFKFWSQRLSSYPEEELVDYYKEKDIDRLSIFVGNGKLISGYIEKSKSSEKECLDVLNKSLLNGRYYVDLYRKVYSTDKPNIFSAPEYLPSFKNPSFLISQDQTLRESFNFVQGFMMTFKHLEVDDDQDQEMTYLSNLNDLILVHEIETGSIETSLSKVNEYKNNPNPEPIDKELEKVTHEYIKHSLKTKNSTKFNSLVSFLTIQDYNQSINLCTELVSKKMKESYKPLLNQIHLPPLYYLNLFINFLDSKSYSICKEIFKFMILLEDTYQFVWDFKIDKHNQNNEYLELVVIF